MDTSKPNANELARIALHKAWAGKAVAALVEDCRVGALVELSREARRLAKVARGMARPKP